MECASQSAGTSNQAATHGARGSATLTAASASSPTASTVVAGTYHLPRKGMIQLVDLACVEYVIVMVTNKIKEK